MGETKIIQGKSNNHSTVVDLTAIETCLKDIKKELQDHSTLALQTAIETCLKDIKKELKDHSTSKLQNDILNALQGNFPSAQNIAQEIIKAAGKPNIFNVVNSNQVQQLQFPTGAIIPPGTMGRLIAIEDYGAGYVHWTMDGNDPTTGPNSYVTTGPYHAAYNIDNVDLGLLKFKGTSTGSDYSILYSIY